jgi:hypothetical protein
MNLRTARNELSDPPKIGLPILALETLGLVAVSYILVGLFT